MATFRHVLEDGRPGAGPVFTRRLFAPAIWGPDHMRGPMLCQTFVTLWERLVSLIWVALVAVIRPTQGKATPNNFASGRRSTFVIPGTGPTRARNSAARRKAPSLVMVRLDRTIGANTPVRTSLGIPVDWSSRTMTTNERCHLMHGPLPSGKYFSIPWGRARDDDKGQCVERLVYFFATGLNF